MKRFTPIVLLACAMVFARNGLGDELAYDGGKTKVGPFAPLPVRAFPLSDVRLLDGPFKRAMELDRAYLLSLDPDRLLHAFRLNAGVPTSAQPLGGWEEPKCEVRGHFAGHYLSGCALLYASTGDERLKEKGNAVVAGMAECQAKLRGGYLSAYPESFIDRVERRQQVWAPYYTLHKILAGLLDMYVYCDNAQALAVAARFGDWVIARTAPLDDEQMQGMLENEHGGMNEGLANLYALTGEEKYLKMSLRFNHHRLVGPASVGEDKLTGLHANTQIPKFIGTARQFELTREYALKAASRFFWDVVVNERSYVIGGHSDGEMFSPKEKLSQALGPNTTETCNTYNLLKLTRHLFCWEPSARYADYYERALLNHILASQNPETGMMCYYLPLRSGSRKNYNTPLDSFWCCTGTGVENHAKYGESIYFQDDEHLYVNLFIASELNWKAKGLKLTQQTRFPDEGGTKLVFHCERPVELSVRVRHPFWAGAGFSLRVNGGEQDSGSPGDYATVKRRWADGDVLEARMPFVLRAEAFRDNTNRFAFLYGPLVLCAEVASNRPFPTVVADQEQYLSGLQPVPGAPNTFTASPEVFKVAGERLEKPILFSPLYQVHGNRTYQVYFDRYSSAQWQARELEYAAEMARRKALEARTVDYVNPGEEQNERDHNLKGEKTSAGDYGDRKYRHGVDGGWFAWDVKILPGQPQELVVTYWGEDSGRSFDVLVDDHRIATQQLTGSHPGSFFDVAYPLPPALTEGKQQITLKFQGPANGFAGGVFGVRLLKAE